MQPNIERLFFAIELGDTLLKQLVAIINILQKQPGGHDIKWTVPENLHMTLRFLGATNTEVIPACLALIRQNLINIPAFTLNLGLFATLPQNYPRVLALTVPITLELARLFQTVEQSLVALAFAPETRPYFPHITLGRKHGKKISLSTLLHDYSLPTLLPLQVEHISLFSSKAMPAGSIYTVIQKISLSPFTV